MIQIANEMKSQFQYLHAFESTPVHPPISLHSLARGQIGTINRLDGTTDQVHRAQELGLRSGARVEMVQPGSPCIVRINETQKFCVRKSDSIGIFVRLAGV